MSELNILCGASIFAKEVIVESNIEFSYVCDSDLSKAGNLFEGIRIIPYDEIKILCNKYKINLFLANRYVTGTVKKLESYFKELNVKIYGFISRDFKEIIEVKNITDYYEKCTLIKKNMFIINSLIRCKKPIDSKILIFTMRKVGTISIRDALEKSLGVTQLHLHSVSDTTGLERGIKNWMDLNQTTISPYYKETSELVRNNIKNKKELKVITVVREPVSRNMSFMFFMLPVMLGANAGILNTKSQKYAYTEIFEDIYYNTIDHDYFMDWFDIELKPSLGIDIYEHTFDKDKGYSVIEKDNIKLLLIKLEKLENCIPVIKQFAEVDKFELKRENSSDNYWYKPIYDNFKKEFIPHEEHLQKLYESKFMKYFYTDKEIEAFYKKWRRKEK